ncbi:bifunctional DNA primase/polymerase [Streptomyces vinaceus]|uniref:bifunctional DNA primase/polymerase n=1 Tax=Streptomyces vinaceus TaxID=1960 RepID=UPI0035DD40AE
MTRCIREQGPGPLAVARWCAERKWPVHPLVPGAKIPPRNCSECRGGTHEVSACPCLPAGGHCHGFHAATTDPARIDAWWSEDRFGVGVACGPARLVVIDIDAHDIVLPTRDRLLPGITIGTDVDLTGLTNGFHTLAVLAALRNGIDPSEDENTLRVRTPSGGLHVWYRATGTDWLSSAGSGRSRALAWQVDVRANGGYIIAPGTVTRAGVYTPLGSCRTPAELPHWLAEELTRTGHAMPPPSSGGATTRSSATQAGRPRSRPSDGRPGSRHLTAVLERVLDDLNACSGVPSGAGFTERLNRAAYTVGGLVAAGHLNAAEGERALMEAAALVRPGQLGRARRVISGGLAAGIGSPLHLRGGL